MSPPCARYRSRRSDTTRLAPALSPTSGVEPQQRQLVIEETGLGRQGGEPIDGPMGRLEIADAPSMQKRRRRELWWSNRDSSFRHSAILFRERPTDNSMAVSKSPRLCLSAATSRSAHHAAMIVKRLFESQPRQPWRATRSPCSRSMSSRRTKHGAVHEFGKLAKVKSSPNVACDLPQPRPYRVVRRHRAPVPNSRTAMYLNIDDAAES